MEIAHTCPEIHTIRTHTPVRITRKVVGVIESLDVQQCVFDCCMEIRLGFQQVALFNGLRNVRIRRRTRGAEATHKYTNTHTHTSTSFTHLNNIKHEVPNRCIEVFAAI